MFTGIVEGIGEVKGLWREGDVMRLALEVPFEAKDVNLGESLAVDGVCLTVVGKKGEEVHVEVSQETLSRTKLSRYRPGTKVNLERALRLGDRIGGHFVTGHVDGVGEVVEVERLGRSSLMAVRAPREVLPYLAEKGSVALDGVSLTVNRIRGDLFWVMLVPFTLERTTLGKMRVGEVVNLEADVLAKYVVRYLNFKGGRGITEEFLREYGFL